MLSLLSACLLSACSSASGKGITEIIWRPQIFLIPVFYKRVIGFHLHFNSGDFCHNFQAVQKLSYYPWQPVV